MKERAKRRRANVLALIESQPDKTLDEIGETLGLSKQRVSQMATKARKERETYQPEPA